MSLNAPRTYFDGMTSVERGMDSGRKPNLLPRNQAAFLGNATSRGGFLRPRQALYKRPLSYASGTNQSEFTDSLFQRATRYAPRGDNPSEYLISQQGGRTFKIDVRTFTVDDITISGDVNPSNRRRFWWQQFEEFLVGQDGQSIPLIYDGVSLRRSNIAENEFPVGTVMSYALGRAWVALPNRNGFVGGDLVYSSSGTPTYAFRDAVLKFTENTFLTGGGAFGVPANAGKITAMHPISVLDTSLGQGPLQVFVENGSFSVNAPFDRTQWQLTTSPIQTVSLNSYGAVSQEGAVNVNSDIWYRSLDGLRSFKVARRNYSDWGDTPQSSEMNRVFNQDTENLLEYSSGALFDNRLLLTVSPQWNADHGVSFKGLAVLDFNELSSMFDKAPPAYDGLWSRENVNILQIVGGRFSGQERCFLFVLNADEEIELWELVNARFDRPDGITDARIPWFVETRAFAFDPKASIYELKKLWNSDVWVDELAGTVDFEITWKPDGYPCWLPWRAWQQCSKYQTCDDDTTCLPQIEYKPRYFPRTTLPQPPDTCQTGVKRPLRFFYETQFRLDIVGYCEIERVRFQAKEVEEQPFDECPPTQAPDCVGLICSTSPCNGTLYPTNP